LFFFVITGLVKGDEVILHLINTFYSKSYWRVRGVVHFGQRVRHLLVVEIFFLWSHFVLRCVLFCYGQCVSSQSDWFIVGCPSFSPIYFSLLHGKMHYGPYFYCLFRCNPFNFDCLFLSFSLMLKFIICQFSPLILICIYNIFSLVLLHLISYFVYFFFVKIFMLSLLSFKLILWF